MKMKKTESTFENIISQVKNYFLDNTVVGETFMELNGQKVCDFLNDKGKKCTYAEVLKFKHLYPSRCRLYLVCDLKNVPEVEPLSVSTVFGEISDTPAVNINKECFDFVTNIAVPSSSDEEINKEAVQSNAEMADGEMNVLTVTDPLLIQ